MHTFFIFFSQFGLGSAFLVWKLYEFPSQMTLLACILPLTSCFLSANVQVCGLAELSLVNLFWSKRVCWKFYWLHGYFWTAETEYWLFWMNFRVLVKSTWATPFECKMRFSGHRMCQAVKIPIDLYVFLLAVFPWHLLLMMFSAIGVSAIASTPCKYYISSSRSAWAAYICSTFTFFLLIIMSNLFYWHMHWSFIQENINCAWNKQIKYIYLGFSNKIARNFQLHIAISTEDKCFTIHHSSLLWKEQGSDIFRFYKPSQTRTLLCLHTSNTRRHMVSQQHLNTIMTVIMPLGQNLPSVTLGKIEFTIFSELLV